MKISTFAITTLLTAFLQRCDSFAVPNAATKFIMSRSSGAVVMRLSNVEDAADSMENASDEKNEAEDEGIKLYVGNLPFEKTPREISEIFTPFGTITKMQVPRDRTTGTRRGFAFVSMATQEMADAAIAALDKTDMDGREIKVSLSLPVGDAPPNTRKEFAPRTKIYIGNMPFEATAEELAELFSAHGTVYDSYVPTDKITNLSRGFAFITMDEENAKAAIEALDTSILYGRELVVNESVPKGAKPPMPRRENVRTKAADNTRRLYVGNLSFDADEEILLDLFTEFGDVKEVFIPTWPDTGRPKGFAFITIAANAASHAIEETDGLEFLGRNIQVNEAMKRSNNTRKRQEEDYATNEE